MTLMASTLLKHQIQGTVFAAPACSCLVPMRYEVIQGQPILAVTFAPDRSRLGQSQVPLPIQPWTFNGRVALRGPLA